MRKTDKGLFKPKNPQKYMGDPSKITYRSSWELTVMLKFDAHPNVVGWGSEVQEIAYYNPVKRKWTVYVPDFIVVTDDGKNNRRVEMLEIKPLAQTPGYTKLTETGRKAKLSKYDLAEQLVNEAKWKAALAFCAKRGWHFQVLTEQSLFGHTLRKGK